MTPMEGAAQNELPGAHRRFYLSVFVCIDTRIPSSNKWFWMLVELGWVEGGIRSYWRWRALEDPVWVIDGLTLEPRTC